MAKQTLVPKTRKKGRPSLYTEALAANSGETESMAILQNARHERFVQGVVKGISPGPAYTAAGYTATGNSAESAAARLLRNVQVQARRAELQGSTAKQITDVRDLARQCTAAAVETLKNVMEDLKAPHSARVAAANSLLDRGHGKATQNIEAELSVYDSLSLAEKQALLEVIDEVIDDLDGGNEGNPERPALTHH